MAEELNRMENGIEDVDKRVTELENNGGSDETKMDKENPVGTGSFSMNKKTGTVVGDYSFAEGKDCTASGEASHAEGYDTIASDVCSHAEGNQTVASGRNSHAEGYCTAASGMSAHVEGDGNGATGDYSHAEGFNVEASGEASHAEGHNTAANNEACHAEGVNTVADDTACHAEGYGSKATVRYSHAEGWNTEAKGEASHVEGLGTIASKSVQHVQGKYNVEDTEGIYTHIVGGGTSTSDRKNIHTIDLQGNAVFAGDVTNGNGVSMDGLKELIESAQNTLAENAGNKANKNNLEYVGSLKGNGATVSEDYKSVSMGEYNTSIGRASFASGGDNNVSGNYATAQGYNCYVSGGYASAAGRYLLASSIDQRVEGRYNAEDTQNQYAYILGNGKSASSRSNAYTVDWSGNAVYSGNLIAANFKGIAKNFTTEDENMAAAAPLVKQLYEENQSLKARIDKIQNQLSARFDVPAKSSITLHMPNQHNLVLFYTHMVIPAYKSITFASAGNGNNTNAGQRATLFRIVESQFVTYEVSNVSGYYNDVIITNSGDYTIYVMCTSFGGTLPTLVN